MWVASLLVLPFVVGETSSARLSSIDLDSIIIGGSDGAENKFKEVSEVGFLLFKGMRPPSILSSSSIVSFRSVSLLVADESLGFETILYSVAQKYENNVVRN